MKTALLFRTVFYFCTNTLLISHNRTFTSLILTGQNKHIFMEQEQHPQTKAPRSKKIIIPVQLVELEDNSYHIIVPVEINGITGDMIIDTGASVTVIDQNILPANQDFEKSGELQSGGVNGEISGVRIIRPDSFKIGGKLIPAARIAVMNLDYVNQTYDQRLSRKIIGLLGCDFCVRFNAIIDYQNKAFTLKL